MPEPHAWIEYDVEDVAAVTAALEARGVAMLVRAKREPWGQTVSRFLVWRALRVARSLSAAATCFSGDVAARGVGAKPSSLYSLLEAPNTLRTYPR